MAAPIGHGIELNTVGELHLVVTIRKLLEFPESFFLSSSSSTRLPTGGDVGAVAGGSSASSRLGITSSRR